MSPDSVLRCLTSSTNALFCLFTAKFAFRRYCYREILSYLKKSLKKITNCPGSATQCRPSALSIWARLWALCLTCSTYSLKVSKTPTDVYIGVSHWHRMRVSYCRLIIWFAVRHTPVFCSIVATQGAVFDDCLRFLMTLTTWLSCSVVWFLRRRSYL